MLNSTSKINEIIKQLNNTFNSDIKIKHYKYVNKNKEIISEYGFFRNNDIIIKISSECKECYKLSNKIIILPRDKFEYKNAEVILPIPSNKEQYNYILTIISNFHLMDKSIEIRSYPYYNDKLFSVKKDKLNVN